MGAGSLRVLAKLVPLWIVLALLFAGLASGHKFLQYRQLVDDGVSVSGTITPLEPSNHALVDYSYTALGKQFSGRGRAGFGTPEFSLLQLGDSVPVWYLPGNANISCLGDPRQLLTHTERFMLGPAVVFPTFILVAHYRKYPRFQAWLTS
jgi:uncharacterized protein DUF3592